MLKDRYLGCVYMATNKANGRIYIGKTVKGLRVRAREHKTSAKNGGQSAFHKAISKYGFDCFEWVELFTSSVDADLIAEEIRIIAWHRLNGSNLYNLTDGGEGLRGLVRTSEHKAKIAAAHKGKTQSAEQSRAHADFMRGRKLTAQHKSAISQGLKGTKKTKEHTERMRAFHLGRKRSDETRARISAVQLGRPCSEGKKQKLREHYARLREQKALDAGQADLFTQPSAV